MSSQVDLAERYEAELRRYGLRDRQVRRLCAGFIERLGRSPEACELEWLARGASPDRAAGCRKVHERWRACVDPEAEAADDVEMLMGQERLVSEQEARRRALLHHEGVAAGYVDSGPARVGVRALALARHPATRPLARRTMRRPSIRTRTARRARSPGRLGDDDPELEHHTLTPLPGSQP